MELKKLILLIAAVTILLNVEAQDKITVRDAKEINFKAAEAVRGLADLLNFVTTPGILKSDLAANIDSSYMTSGSKIFYGNKVIIENDIDPVSDTGKISDVMVEKYLNDLDLKYVKSTGSIKFTINHISAIKSAAFLFVRVTFYSKFESKYKINNSAYRIKQREAIVRLERTGGNNWNAFITGVKFYNPSSPIESTENNVPITMETQTISQDSLAVIIKRDSTIKADSIKRNQMLSINYIRSADSLIENSQFVPALEILEKARELMRFSPSLTIKINFVKSEIVKNTYKNYKSKGDDEKSAHRYLEAIQLYRRANSRRSESDVSLQPEIDALSKKLNIIDLPKNILQAGVTEDAIKECERILGLKENRNIKNEFPELYFIEALAYQKILENKSNDSRTMEKAIENFNQAIDYFPNYKDAHIARASFFIKYKNDLVSAITDYDALIRSSLDHSPEMPAYYAKKAKWEDMAQNFNSAYDDYSKAISLNPKADSLYFARGELLYRQNRVSDAQKDLDSAILLNNKSAGAFYCRGLNYVKIKNNYNAGVDFAQAEKLGIDSAQLGVIVNISNSFFLKAQEFANKHDFINADSSFNNALKIRSCNAMALHGKAEIRFITGNELYQKKDFTAANASYRVSIMFNNQAIKCNPNLSDGYFKNGLAQKKVAEIDLAINSFSEAIRTDNNNIEAYIERGNTLQLQQKYAIAAGDYIKALDRLKVNYEAAKKQNNISEQKDIVNNQSKVNQLHGQALYYLFDFANSLTSLNQALDLNENNSDALYYRGLIYYVQNEFSKSIRDFDKALKVMPDYRYYYDNGRANLKNKNYPEAIKNFDGAIQYDTLNIIKNKYFLRGLSYFKNKSINEAFNDFNEYNNSPGSKADTAFFADYGVVRLFAGKDSLAVVSFNHAISLSANNSKALFGLGCYYAKAGQFEKALELFEKAFATREISKEDIKPEEDAFLIEFNKDKTNRSRYTKLKKTYLNN
jgi:tetratricopeptide (TPR) repeat protein